jgi:hypothetical protein
VGVADGGTGVRDGHGYRESASMRVFPCLWDVSQTLSYLIESRTNHFGAITEDRLSKKSAILHLQFTPTLEILRAVYIL